MSLRIPVPRFLPWLCLGLVSLGSAQDDAEKGDPTPEIRPGVPVKLDIARRFLKNFIVDEVALTPYADAEGEPRDFHGAFVIGSSNARHAVIWDPRACRLVGVLDLEAPEPAPEKSSETEKGPEDSRKSDGESPGEPEPAVPSPYTLLASGPPPFTSSAGAFGLPEYFGFRLDGGRPVLLYTHGMLVIEECLWLEDEGAVLKMRYVLRNPESDLSLTLPADWVPRIETPVGTWKENILSIPKEAANEFELTLLLDREEPAETEESN